MLKDDARISRMQMKKNKIENCFQTQAAKVAVGASNTDCFFVDFPFENMRFARITDIRFVEKSQHFSFRTFLARINTLADQSLCNWIAASTVFCITWANVASSDNPNEPFWNSYIFVIAVELINWICAANKYVQFFQLANGIFTRQSQCILAPIGDR